LDSTAIYKLLKAKGQPDDPRANFVSGNHAPPRVQLFMWLLLQGRIHARSVLHKKRILVDKTCELCNEQDETPEHIINGCHIATMFWQRLQLPQMLQLTTQSLHTISANGGIPTEEFSAFIALGCWQLWKTRNAKVFRQESTSVDQLITKCKTAAQEWRFRLPTKRKQVADIWCNRFEMARTGQG